PHSTLSRGHQAEEETSGKDSDQKRPVACPEALNQDATDPDHLEERIQKEKRHITAAAETPKAIIRVPAREERSSLLRGIMIEKHTHVREEGCQKARTVQKDIENLNLKSKGQVWRMRTYPSHGHVKTYNGSEDPEDHLKIFQAAAKVERWAMPTWCHMFNSTLTGNAKVWFDNLLPESIDSYDDLKEAFLENYLQQKKCIKDPVEIHHIKQREWESMEDFVLKRHQKS
ncbi:reverse transcriptase domain-containing protein, partial [Tanacetum coccineum]